MADVIMDKTPMPLLAPWEIRRMAMAAVESGAQQRTDQFLKNLGKINPKK